MDRQPRLADYARRVSTQPAPTKKSKADPLMAAPPPVSLESLLRQHHANSPLALPAATAGPLREVRVGIRPGSTQTVASQLHDLLLRRDDVMVQGRTKVMELLAAWNPSLGRNQPSLAFDMAAFTRTSQLRGATRSIGGNDIHDLLVAHVQSLAEPDRERFMRGIPSMYDVLLWLNDQGFAPTLYEVRSGVGKFAPLLGLPTFRQM